MGEAKVLSTATRALYEWENLQISPMSKISIVGVVGVSKKTRPGLSFFRTSLSFPVSSPSGGLQPVPGVEVSRAPPFHDVQEIGRGSESEGGGVVDRSMRGSFRVPHLSRTHPPAGKIVLVLHGASSDNFRFCSGFRFSRQPIRISFSVWRTSSHSSHVVVRPRLK